MSIEVFYIVSILWGVFAFALGWCLGIRFAIQRFDAHMDQHLSGSEAHSPFNGVDK